VICGETLTSLLIRFTSKSETPSHKGLPTGFYRQCETRVARMRRRSPRMANRLSGWPLSPALSRASSGMQQLDVFRDEVLQRCRGLPVVDAQLLELFDGGEQVFTQSSPSSHARPRAARRARRASARQRVGPRVLAVHGEGQGADWAGLSFDRDPAGREGRGHHAHFAPDELVEIRLEPVGWHFLHHAATGAAAIEHQRQAGLGPVAAIALVVQRAELRCQPRATAMCWELDGGRRVPDQRASRRRSGTGRRARSK